VTMHNLLAVTQDPDHPFYPFKIEWDNGVVVSVE
jgi:hypothetical protein